MSQLPEKITNKSTEIRSGQKKSPGLELRETLFKERKTTLNSKINIFLCLW